MGHRNGTAEGGGWWIEYRNAWFLHGGLSRGKCDFTVGCVGHALG